jgi:ketosteroid isomerase-like protein
MMAGARDVVTAFIAAINRRSAADMGALMTEDHTFVDSTGRIQTGREEMIASWEQYFRMFPDFRIQVETMLEHESIVAAFGFAAGTYNGRRGLVPENRIEMPASWRAVVADGGVRIWQVYADWTEGLRIIGEDNQHIPAQV